MLKVQTCIKTSLKVCDSFQTSEGVTIPVIGGTTSLSEVVSPNGYRYRDSFWKTVLSQAYVQEMIANRTSLGTIEHPVSDNDYLRTPYEDASHVVLSVELRDSNPYCTFGILNNSKGNSIKALIELGVPVGVSTRGLGDTLEDAISPYIDESNYGLITWDVVSNPNFGSLALHQISDSVKSSPIFKELVEAYQLRDSSDCNYSGSGLTSYIDKALAALNELKSQLPSSGSTDKSITGASLGHEYEDLDLYGCDIVTLPAPLRVKDTLTLRGTRIAKLPSGLQCGTLDIRGCDNLTSLPDDLVCNHLIASGSGLSSIPPLRFDSLNAVRTPLRTIPKGAFVGKLTVSDSIAIEGSVARIVRI